MASQIIPTFPVGGLDAAKIQGESVSLTDPAAGQVLVWDAVLKQYVPQTVSGPPTAHKASHATGGSDALSTADIGALPLAGGTVTGALTVNGNTTLGDAAGDSATINAGTLTAPNATAVGATNIANVGAIQSATLFSFPVYQTTDNQSIANGAAKFLGAFRVNSFSLGIGAHVPNEFTRFRVVLYFGWTTVPGADTFPIYVRFDNRVVNSTTTPESLHGTRYGAIFYPDTSGGLAGTLTYIGPFPPTGKTYKFIGDWTTLPAGWQANAATNGWYEFMGVAIGNGSGGALTDGMGYNHGCMGRIDFSR